MMRPMTPNAPQNRTRPWLPQSTRRTTNSIGHLTAFLLIAASASILSTGRVTAGTPCDALPHACDAGACDCGTCRSPHLRCQNPILQTLDTVAGGIEKIFGLDRCTSAGCTSASCGSSCCDGGCDAGLPMVFERSPTPIEHHHHHDAAPEKTSPRHASPSLPIVPPLAPAPSQPKMTKPRIVTPDAAPALLEPEAREVAPRVPEMTAPRLVPTEMQPRTLPEPKNEVQPEPKKDGSIFDALDNLDDLDDPFQEDAARLRRQYGSIRPTGLRSSTAKIPAYRTALPPQNDRPAPRLLPQPVGSGLRPAMTIEPLRPVSHEEPIDVNPMGTRRILAPYRASR